MTIHQNPVSVFLSYAQKDKQLLLTLETHLSLLKQQGLISTWSVRQIVPGTNRSREIDRQLEQASIILLLVSADFLASDYCYQVEMKRALERHEAGQACIIPIIVRTCDWSGAPFAHLQALPTNDRPITKWPDKDEAWTSVVQSIRQVIEALPVSVSRVTLPAMESKEPEPVRTSEDKQPDQIVNQPAVQGQASDDDRTFTSTAHNAILAHPPAPTPQSLRFGGLFPEVWNVFRRHNPFFTGRAHVLQQLFDGFRLENEAGMATPQAITGLGGMGKTQAVAEYAYRFRGHYRAVLWVRAETQENLMTDFKTLAGLLKRPQEHLQDRTSLIQTMQEWFTGQTDWLLIFDNVDNLTLVEPFLPRAARGHFLLTTRAGATSGWVQPLRLDPLGPDDGALCILRRASMLGWNKQLQDAPAASVDAARHLAQLMEGLPLAMEQAGAYIDDTECGIRRYLRLYQQYRSEMQQTRHGLPTSDYSASVASAWRMSRSVVEHRDPAAAELLRLCAYLAPEAIPDELVTIGASALGSVLGPVAANPVLLDQTIGLLRKYSLLNREVDGEADLTRLSIHRVMQEILLDEMDQSTQRLWAERAVRTVAQGFPVMPWSILQAHARNCLQLIEQWQMAFPAAEQLQRFVAEQTKVEGMA